jgi:Cys-tRNA(Pro) deacylase
VRCEGNAGGRKNFPLREKERKDVVSRRDRVSETPATAFLKKHGVEFSEHVFEYEDHGGTRVAARALGVDEHATVKTLVMEDERKLPLIVLMHGDRSVSTKNLARQVGAKRIEPCSPDAAQRHSGYQVGGTSPFGVRKSMPVYLEKTVLALPKIYINGGRRGYLVGLTPSELVHVLKPVLVEVGLAD